MKITATLFSVLADPTRLKIIELLRDYGPLPVGSIAENLSLRQPQTSKHLKILFDNDLLELTSEGNKRIYQLNPTPFTDLKNWCGRYESLMAQKFDKLDTYLSQITKEDN